MSQTTSDAGPDASVRPRVVVLGFGMAAGRLVEDLLALAARAGRPAPARARIAPMKLDALDVIVTAPPAPGWGGRYWILVKLTSDSGITGWGECYASTVGPRAMMAVIHDVFARHMEGEDPARVELMFRRAYSSGFTQRSTGWCRGEGRRYWVMVISSVPAAALRQPGGSLIR